MSDSNSATPGTQRRSPSRPSAAPLAKIAMVTFAIGLVAILADLVLFASGSRNLPVWLNVLCMLAPVGLGLGLLGVVREARSASRPATRVSTRMDDEPPAQV